VVARLIQLAARVASPLFLMAIAKVTDPQGYEVTLEEERWKHITDGHPEVSKLLDILIKALAEPELICRDKADPEVHFYYRLTGRSVLRRDDIYMSAVVERSEGNKIANVKTAHLVKQPKKGGEIVWFKPQMSSR
jgi:hypothetical protein